ncbi:MAG: hypothetical protein HOO92_09400, partial [Methylococcaceae bacterium]|nr:hypothetical protein [Methylococcaceae bacterium]
MKFFKVTVLLAFLLPLSGCDGQTSEGKSHESAASKQSADRSSPNSDEYSRADEILSKKFGSTEEQIAKLHKEAEAGDAVAQQKLGFYYDTQKDAVNAFEWTQKAAAQGGAVAQRKLGAMYESGEGTQKDDVKAVEWYQKAATQGDVVAQVDLAMCYDKGTGTTKDDAKAAEWYQKAAAQGNAYAQLQLGYMYSRGTGVNKDLVKASEWYQKAAELGDAPSQYSLGYMYSHGNGVSKDSVKAFEWYQKAAAQGNASAKFGIGVLYANGEGVSKDYVRAYAWFNLAAAQGHSDAQLNRDRFENWMTSAEVKEGQRLASNWKKGETLLPPIRSLPESALQNHELSKQQTGTAFVVSSNGHALTNHHVINGCTEVKVAGHEGVAKVITSDSVNDLALLQLPGINNNFAKFNPEPGKLRQGEDVIVFGYPLNFAL